MPKSLIYLFLLLLALGGCDAGDSELGPGGVSKEDATALDDAAAKLDAETTGDSK